MKVGKFLRHIDFCAEVEIYDKNEKLLYSGSVIPFHAIVSKDSRYYEECVEDGDLEAADEYRQALKVNHLKLDTCAEYEAVNIKMAINKHGVKRFILIIFVKE